MNAITPRNFIDAPAARTHVPLLVGLMGPSGSGKTMSSLRLATGIQRVTGGEIFFVDTESKRALHYADQFKFRHIEFGAPFGSLDYLAALKHCVAKNAGVIIVDSLSHEHIGPGGYLMTQEAEVERMAGDDYAKRERVKMAGWIKPAKLRQLFVTGLLQLNSNFIFCFRAKEKTKPVPGKQPVEMGFMPIAGEELMFEMTLNCLLLPKAGGVPTWRSDHIGEKLMMKCPQQFGDLFSETKPLDESIGQSLAEWARGGARQSAPAQQGTATQEQGKDFAPAARAAAEQGTAAFRAYWQGLSKTNRGAIKASVPEYQRIAEEADRRAAEPAADLDNDDPFANSAAPPHEAESGGAPADPMGAPPASFSEEALAEAYASGRDAYPDMGFGRGAALFAGAEQAPLREQWEAGYKAERERAGAQ